MNGTLASGSDVGIFYGTTNPAAAGLVISPRGIGSGIKMATNGNVGINNNNPTVELDVVGNIKASANITASTLNLSGAITGATNNTINGISINNRAVSTVTSINFMTGGTIATNGGVITTGGGRIDTQGGRIDTQGGAINTGNGTITTTGQITAGSFNTGSDYRIKKNIQPLNEMITIDNLKPIEYDLSGGSHDMGFLAHEVQEIFPFLVTGEKDGEKIQTLNYNGFIALLVKEVQDLKTENRELKERMDRLEKYFM
jgi:hypothetical protein